MNNELKIFSNEEFGQVRTVLKDGEAWFVGKDVCEVFGDTNYRRSLSRLDEEEKAISQVETGNGLQNMSIINESGLYSLLFQMQPLKAKGVSQNELLIDERVQKLKKFKHWVTSEVLPSIRRTGGYIQGQEILSEEELMARALEVARKTLERREQRLKDLEQTVSVQNQRIAELQPKADYTDKILQSKSLMTITQIAKDYGMSGKRMNEILNQFRVQYKQNGQWLLYSKYQSKGYTSSETISFRKDDGRTITKLDTKWTQKGRLFLYNLLKENDIIPTIEQDNAF